VTETDLTGEPAKGKSRIASLDLIRGVAILGILTVNIEGFAGPIAASVTPDWNGPADPASHFAFAAVMVLFEGKMRALLSLLFGAGMVLFLDGAAAAGRDGTALQLRRLTGLAVIGYLHFALLWWGDILFTYACAGFFALSLCRLPQRTLTTTALLAFAAWHALGIASSLSPVIAERQADTALSSPVQIRSQHLQREVDRHEALAEQQRELGGFVQLIAHKLRDQPLLPLIIAMNSLGETLPLMLLGMVLYRSGFFTGSWPRRRLWLFSAGGLTLGGGATLGLTAMAWNWHFAPTLMEAMLSSWLALPHLAMALGYAALLVLATRRFATTALAGRVVAIGKMALTMYLGCTLIMTGLFYGWGLGLSGSVPESRYWVFILATWFVMLIAGPFWLRHFRQGPIEWLWRTMTYGRAEPFLRKPAGTVS
jgi:uncharacterized protein